MASKKMSEKTKWIITLISVALILFFVPAIFIAVANNLTNEDNTSRAGLYERKADSRCFEIEQGWKTNFSDNVFDLLEDWYKLGDLTENVKYEFRVTPKYNVDDVEFKLVWYDEDDNELDVIYKYIGDTRKGRTYKIDFTLEDINLSQVKNLDHTTYYVSSGTISFFKNCG